MEGSAVIRLVREVLHVSYTSEHGLRGDGWRRRRGRTSARIASNSSAEPLRLLRTISLPPVSVSVPILPQVKSTRRAVQNQYKIMPTVINHRRHGLAPAPHTAPPTAACSCCGCWCCCAAAAASCLVKCSNPSKLASCAHAIAEGGGWAGRQAEQARSRVGTLLVPEPAFGARSKQRLRGPPHSQLVAARTLVPAPPRRRMAEATPTAALPPLPLRSAAAHPPCARCWCRACARPAAARAAPAPRAKSSSRAEQCIQ